MITDILNDAARDGNIVAWQMVRRLLFPDTWRIWYADGDIRSYGRDAIIDICTNLAIFRGEIPDPDNDEGSYSCG